MFYNLVFRLVFTRLDPEWIHHTVVRGIRVAKVLGITRIGALRGGEAKKVEAFGLTFDGAFGLAAGFDKNAVAVRALGDLGFSHVEIGTVTALAQPGNEKPRLFRLPADRALINRMGFNNDGAEVVAQRLGALRASYGQDLPIIGVNIGKSKVTPVEAAADDYRASARLLAPFADYLAVNVSSPNTPGLRSLQEVSALRPILEAVLAESLGLPVLVKIAPDLADEDILAVADLALELGLAGVIATNTTIGREGLKTAKSRIDEIGAGGLSGAPLKQRSLEVLRLLAGHLKGRMAIISVGGVETAEEARQRLESGASLVQGYSGFIYEGPFWARRVNRGI
ncbi:MAG: quinone-dependent dihydroorotate dehydrogenase [Micrococcales bacterium]